MQGSRAQTPANKRAGEGDPSHWTSRLSEWVVLGHPAPSFAGHWEAWGSDCPALQEEMLCWLQGVSTAINESQSIRVKAQSLPLPSNTGPDVNLGKKDKEKRFSFFPKKK